MTIKFWIPAQMVGIAVHSVIRQIRFDTFKNCQTYLYAEALQGVAGAALAEFANISLFNYVP